MSISQVVGHSRQIPFHRDPQLLQIVRPQIVFPGTGLGIDSTHQIPDDCHVIECNWPPTPVTHPFQVPFQVTMEVLAPTSAKWMGAIQVIALTNYTFNIIHEYWPERLLCKCIAWMRHATTIDLAEDEVIIVGSDMSTKNAEVCKQSANRAEVQNCIIPPKYKGFHTPSLMSLPVMKCDLEIVVLIWWIFNTWAFDAQCLVYPKHA